MPVHARFGKVCPALERAHQGNKIDRGGQVAEFNRTHPAVLVGEGLAKKLH